MNSFLPVFLICILFAGSLDLRSQPDTLTAQPPPLPDAKKERVDGMRQREPIPATTDPDMAPPAADTQSVNDFTPLWESDTMVIGQDSVRQFRQAPRVRGDTAGVDEDYVHSPSQAVMFALAVPGLGQAYNRKYWKIPIVWAAFGGAGYAIYFNGRNYRLASEEYALNPDDDLNERILRYWRRNLELSYIGLIAVYALQVVDAYVDAQLYSWDVNENLSMRVAPSVEPLMAYSGYSGSVYGLSCRFTLKRK